MRQKLEYLNQYTGKNTPTAHRSALRAFLKVVLKTEIGRFDGLEPFTEKYLSQHSSLDDMEDDVKSFFATIKDSPPKTVISMLSIVRIFFRENHVHFDEDFWKGVNKKVKGRRAWTEDRIPAIEELRSIITHQDAMGKAIILILCSSGMRIGELVKIKESDINFTSVPVSIYISGMYTKTGQSRTAFISTEAVEVLKEWLKIRKDRLKGIQRKGVPRALQSVSPEQIERYRDEANRRGALCFVAIGLGGLPDQPRELSIIPLSYVSPNLPMSTFQYFKKVPTKMIAEDSLLWRPPT